MPAPANDLHPREKARLGKRVSIREGFSFFARFSVEENAPAEKGAVVVVAQAASRGNFGYMGLYVGIMGCSVCIAHM